MRDMEHQRQIIDTFVNSVYVFDDRVVLNFNFTDDSKTISREEVLGSSAVDNAPPHKNPQTFVWGFFVCGGGTGRKQGARAIVYNRKRQDTTIMVIPCLCCCTTVRTCTGGGRYSGRPCFRVLYRPRQPNLQIVCSTAIQSSSAFRKEPFPQSLSSCA